MIRAIKFSIILILCIGCDQNLPRVYYDGTKKLLYIDSLQHPDFYIYSATAFDGKQSVLNFPFLGYPGIQPKQYSLKRELDSLNMQSFALDISLKKDPSTFVIYYVDVTPDAARVEFKPVERGFGE